MRPLSYILTTALFVFSAFLAIDLIRQTRADLIFHLARDLPALQRAQHLDPERAAIPREVADAWMNAFPPRPDRALPAYRATALREPEEGLHWIGLARANLRLGRVAQASRALAAAEFADPNNRIIQKELGNLYLELGAEERALEHHARALALDHALLRTLSPYYLGLGLKPRAVAERLLGRAPDLLAAFFTSCLARGSAPDEVNSLWAYLKTQPGAPPLILVRDYFAYLIAQQEFPAARALWGYAARTFYRQAWDPAREPLWNADLSREPIFPGGLEWQIADPPPTGCEVEITRSDSRATSRSLALHFAGTSNLAFSHVRHAFFVEPGRRYTLRAHAQARGLTTDNGPYLAVILHAQPQQVVKSKVVTESGSQELALDFTAPPDCRWAELLVRRDFSTRLNNKIKGDIWLNAFALCPGPESLEGARP